MSDTESNSTLTDAPSGLLTESVIDVSDNEFEGPSSSSSRKIRGTSSEVRNFGQKKRVGGVLVRQGRNAIWVCDTCQKELSNTNAAKAHLWAKHQITVDSYMGEDDKAKRAALKRRRALTGSPSPLVEAFAKSASVTDDVQRRQTEEVLRSVINQQELQNRIIELITQRDLPYSAVEWPEFKSLLKACNPFVEDKLVNSRTTVPKLIKSAFDHHKSRLKALLKESEVKIH